MTPPITVAEFKAWFTREFVYGATPDKVMDADIEKALAQGAAVFNPGIWEDLAEKKLAFYYLAAHFLFIDLKAAGGLSATNLGKGVDAVGGGLIQSKSVGQVSISYENNQSISQDAILSPFLLSAFGQKYLSLFMPRKVGNVYAVEGSNDPLVNDGAPFVL